MRILGIIALAVLATACGPQPASAPAAQPAPAKVAEPAKPAAAQPAPPAAQPAAPKPAAEKPAAAPAQAPKPAAEKPAAAQPAKPAAAKPAGLSLKQVVVGAPAQTSSYYVYTAALAKLLQSKFPDSSFTVSEAGGSADNARRLADNKIHFSLAAYAGLYPIYAGIDPTFKDKPVKELRALWAIDPVAEAWFVREDTGITNVEQLQGKDFAGGGRGSASDQIARNFAFPALGVEPRWYVGGAADVLEALKNRRITGMGKATALRNPDATIMDVMTSIRIRILAWTPEQIQKVRAKHPWMNTIEIPAGVYKADWNSQPITTWQNGAGIFTATHLPEDIGYAVTKSAVEDVKQADSVQAAAFLAMKGADMPALTMRLASVPLHAGSYRYFKEIGTQLPDRLKPPEVK
ncbi:MAG: TAXI family TRAP transporter solute-binding subunit [Chloroflexi bacterium]|nr:TAXI family TRAP transporter solute-binding subunit [Chloroflexota bacterium]